MAGAICPTEHEYAPFYGDRLGAYLTFPCKNMTPSWTSAVEEVER
jgi:hypothetical protein